MLRNLSADIISSEKRTVFRERSSRKTVSYEEQIMSKYKYPSIFSQQMEAIVFIILQIFFATHAILKIGEYSRIFSSFSWGIFGHVTHLGQSRASKKIWWIIMRNILRNIIREREYSPLENSGIRNILSWNVPLLPPRLVEYSKKPIVPTYNH